MENGKSKRIDKFFAGKGFYIVLALCVAVIGISSVSLIKTANNAQIPDLDTGISLENPTAPVTQTETPVSEKVDIDDSNGAVVSTWKSEGSYEAPEAWVWPVRGEIERDYSVEALAYDVTMRDWRTHDGVDVVAEQGEVVRAAAAGTVESIENDDLYGTTVVIDHGDGLKSSYSNLADTPTVSVGDSVNAGDVIGSVGSTALCEIGQGSHVHIAMSKDGESVNPADYLPS